MQLKCSRRKADNYFGEYSGYGNRYYRKYGYYGKDRATA